MYATHTHSHTWGRGGSVWVRVCMCVWKCKVRGSTHPLHYDSTPSVTPLKHITPTPTHPPAHFFTLALTHTRTHAVTHTYTHTHIPSTHSLCSYIQQWVWALWVDAGVCVCLRVLVIVYEFSCLYLLVNVCMYRMMSSVSMVVSERVM